MILMGRQETKGMVKGSGGRSFLLFCSLHWFYAFERIKHRDLSHRIAQHWSFRMMPIGSFLSVCFQVLPCDSVATLLSVCGFASRARDQLADLDRNFLRFGILGLGQAQIQYAVIEFGLDRLHLNPGRQTEGAFEHAVTAFHAMIVFLLGFLLLFLF